MAGGNLSPRQKMINMMYLVLTALLALNVSKETFSGNLSVTNPNFNYTGKLSLEGFHLAEESIGDMSLKTTWDREKNSIERYYNDIT